MNPFDRLLHYFALREGRRVDGFNLAIDPARSLLPHRLFAGLLAVALLFTTLIMTGRWQEMKNSNPPTRAHLADLKLHLQEAQTGADQLRASFNPEEAKQLGLQVREANFLIALRALRPSEQLADLEAIKPFAVRFSGLRRRLDRDGTVEFGFKLIAVDRGGFESLRDRITRSHRFSELQLHNEMLTPNGYEADISLVWAPVGAPEKTELPPAPSSAPGPQPAARSAGAAAPAASAETRPRAPSAPQPGHAAPRTQLPGARSLPGAPRATPSGAPAATYYTPRPPAEKPSALQPPAAPSPGAPPRVNGGPR
jgi:hypothetical protein